MAARIVDKLPEEDDWTYEVQFDGYRALLIKGGERLQIRSETISVWRTPYATVAAVARELQARQVDADLSATVFRRLAKKIRAVASSYTCILAPLTSIFN